MYCIIASSFDIMKVSKLTMNVLYTYVVFAILCSSVKCSDECRLDYECATAGEYCCERGFLDSKCQSSCVGETCTFDSDCAPGESCRSSKCGVTDECSYDYQCSSKHTLKKYCCERRYPEFHICASDCLGESCIVDSGCASGECCSTDNKCKSSGCDIDIDLSGLAGWVVAVIVISILVVVVLPIAIAVFCCFCAAGAAASSRRRPVQGGVVFAQQPTTTVVAAQHTQQQQPLPPGPAYPPMNAAPPPYSYPPPPNFQQGPPQGLPPQAQPGQPSYPPYAPYQAAGSSPFQPGLPSKQ